MTDATTPVIDQSGALPLSSQPVRLGCVSFLNTLPLIEGLGKLSDVRLTLTAPARLIDLLLADQIDLGLISIIDFQRSPEPLVMVPAGMIGCDGPTLTVRVFSSRPVDQLTRLHADVDSHTSIALARIVLAERLGVHPELVDFDADAHRASGSREWPESILVIGDKVVTDVPPAERYPHQLDLGQAWKEMTGLPFVYAAWMCRQRDVERLGERLSMVAAVLDRQRRHNATRLDWMTASRAPVRGWPTDLARHYLQDLLRFEVNDEHRLAVERFFDLAHAHSLIGARRPTLWLDAAGS